jgi:predicted Fe-Mo cluster-binding NifX family protein
MALSASALPEESRRIALLVMRSNMDVALCPFFGKCDGVLVFDPHKKSQEFHVNEQRTATAMCDLILKIGVDRVVSGFIGGTAVQKLRAAGIDVRLGSCSCAVEDLAAGFDGLPRA